MSCTDVQTIQAGNGTKTQFSFDFPYIFKSEIHVYFWNATTKEWDEKLTTDGTYPWRITDANPTIVEFTSTAPPSPTTPTDPGEPTVDNVRIRRITNLDDIRALFNPGSAIRSDDLNNNFEQLRYAIQESNCPGIPEDVQAYLENYYWDRFDNTLYDGNTWVSDDTKIATTAALDDRFWDKDGETITQAEQNAGSPAAADTNVFTALAAARRFDTIVSQTEQSTAVNWEVGKTWLQNDSEKTVRIWDGSAWVAVASGGAFTTLPKVVYVDAVNGDDSLEGHRISNPKRTIKAAIEQINAETDEVGDGSVVIVAPGVYQETAPIDIQKKNVSIIGQALRSCIVHPTSATEENTLFRLNSGSYIANLTLTGVKASGTRGGNALDTNATHGLPTNQGWNFAFYPGATIVKSPYIANCTNFSDSEIDNDDLNAFNPRGGLGGDTDSAPTGGGILIDGSVVNSNSPLRSMVCDSYTHVGLDGPGIFVTNNGYCQATSSYAFFTHYHIKALNGGQANLAASTSDFGRFGLIAEGRSSSAIFTASTTANANSGATTFTINAPTAASGWHGSATRPQANMVVDVGGNTYSIISATANGTGWDVEISRPNPDNLSDNLGLNGAVNSGSAVSFFLRSMIASSGHTMEYVGSGTNYSALPENGGVPVEANEIVEVSDGKVWAATTNHQGKFTVGPTFNVDQVTGYVNIANGAIGIEQLIENLDLNSFTLSDSTGDVTIDDQLDMNTHKIVNVVDPTGAQDAATKSYADTKLPLAGGTMTGNIVMSGSETVDGRDLSVDGAKLDGIESGADVTDATNVDAAGAVMNSDTTTASMNFVVDEDAMTSDSDTKVPTQQSVKAYADTKLPLAGGTMTGDLTMNAQSDIKFADSDSSNWVAVQAPATIGTNYTLTLPNSVGNAGEALITDAGGNLSWSSNIATVVDQIIEGDTKVEAVDTGTDGEIQFTTDGTRAMTIDNNQRVGIGTSTLANVLHVHQTDATANSYVHITQADGGSAATDGLSIGIEDGGVNAVIRNRETGYLRMYTNDQERLRIDSSGRVGIGTTSPDGELDVTGTGDANGGVLVVNDAGAIGVEVVSPQPTILLNETDTTDENYQVRLDSGDLLIQTQTDARTGASTRVIIDSTGRVGVGTTSPDDYLTIADTSTTGDIGLRFKGDASSRQFIMFGDPGGAQLGDIMYDHGTDAMRFRVNNSERVRIDSSGRVGIGTTSPAGTLHVNGQTYIQGTVSGGQANSTLIANSSGQAQFWALGADTSTTGSMAFVVARSNLSSSLQAVTIDAAGRVGIGTSSPQRLLSLESDGSDYQIIIRDNDLAAAGAYWLQGNVNGSYKIASTAHTGGALTSVIDRLVINSSGNVGIGTTSPSTVLHVSDTDGAITIQGTRGTGSTHNITTGGANSQNLIVNVSDDLFLDANDIVFRSASDSEYARISSGRLLIGTTSARSTAGFGSPKLQLVGDYQGSILITNNEDNTNISGIVMSKIRNTSIVQNGDNLGYIIFAGYDGGQDRSGAYIFAQVDGTPGSADMPTRLVFSTTADGASSPTERMRITNAGHVLPGANNTYDLGNASTRWRNLYTNDLNLSNEGSTNDVDGTWGSWTIQEGEDDLFLLNRRNGKKYKFNLTEVS